MAIRTARIENLARPVANKPPGSMSRTYGSVAGRPRGAQACRRVVDVTWQSPQGGGDDASTTLAARQQNSVTSAIGDLATAGVELLLDDLD